MVKIVCTTGIRSTELPDVACQAMAELGIHHVDLLAMEQWHINPSRLAADAAQEAAHIRAVFDRYGLDCIVINLGFVRNFSTCTDEEHQVNLEVVKEACLLAQMLGTSIITVSPSSMGDEDRQVILDLLENATHIHLCNARVGRSILSMAALSSRDVIFCYRFYPLFV